MRFAPHHESRSTIKADKFPPAVIVEVLADSAISQGLKRPGMIGGGEKYYV